MSTEPLEGKTALVTGATSGIGGGIAFCLAQRRARVVIVARDRSKGEKAAQEIRTRSGNPHVECMVADLSSQSALRELSQAVHSEYPQLQILVNNAVVLSKKRLTSPDGLELMFATNHLAYFLLTNLLRDLLKANSPCSIWNITAPSTTQLNFDDLQGARKFSAIQQFGASKTANLLFTFALARRLEGSRVVVNAYHPGLARSNLMREAPLLMRIVSAPMYLTAAPPERAAMGLVELAATNAGGANGQFFHGTKSISAPAYTQDRQVQERLWKISAELVGFPTETEILS